MSRSDMKVSVVIPTFNRRSLVRETLASVFAQSLPPHEVIVVDDGSTDGTEEVVRRFPVRYIRQGNSGQNAARAAGARIATGDWISFLDDDDLWKPSFLATMAERMPPSAVFGFANYVLIENGVWGEHDMFADAPAGFFDRLDQPLYSRILEWLPILPSTSLIRSDHYQNIGGIDLRYGRGNCQDFEFSLRCTEAAAATAVHDVLVGIRRHPVQQTKNRLNMNLGRVHALRWARTHHSAAEILPEQLESAITVSTIEAFNEAFVSGRLDVVRELAPSIPARLQTPRVRIKIALARGRFPGTVARILFGR